jgi:small subunit ribosomal protein S20
MANHPSAEKRNRQRITRAAQNLQRRTRLRTALKAARSALLTGDVKAAAEKVTLATVLLARAAGTGLIHKNAAARVTSRIRSQLSKLG